MKMYDEFMPEVVCALSDVGEGTMKHAGNGGEIILSNAQKFLRKCDIPVEKTIRVRLNYDSENFLRFYEVSNNQAGNGVAKESTIVSDALFTKEPGLALFLPLADCVGAVMYDPKKDVLGVSHLGRHNLLQHGGSASVAFMISHFGCRAKDIRVILTAAASGEHYPLYAFNNRSLHDVAREQLERGGVTPSFISIDSRDTVTDPKLFSHSEALKSSIAIAGRQAVVAMLTD